MNNSKFTVAPDFGSGRWVEVVERTAGAPPFMRAKGRGTLPVAAFQTLSVLSQATVTMRHQVTHRGAGRV